MNSGKEAFHQPATQKSAILCLGFLPVSSIRRNHLNTLSLEFINQLVAAVRTVTAQIFRFGFNLVEVKLSSISPTVRRLLQYFSDYKRFWQF